MAIGPYDSAPQRRPQVRYVSQHVPMPFKEIMHFKERRTQAYNQNQAMADAVENMANVQALAKDKALRNERVAEYEDEMMSKLRESKGDYSLMSGDIRNMARRLKTELSRGRLGQISNNLASAQAYQKELDEMYSNDSISLDQYNTLSAMSMDAYEGVQNDPMADSYNTFSGVKAAQYQDLQKYVDEHLKGWKADQIAKKQWGLENGKYWRLSGGKKEFVDAKELEIAALNAMQNDPKIRAYVQQDADMQQWKAGKNESEFDRDSYIKNSYQRAANFGAAKYGYSKTLEIYDDIKFDQFKLAADKRAHDTKMSLGLSHQVSWSTNPAFASAEERKKAFNGGAQTDLDNTYRSAASKVTGISNPNDAMKAVVNYYTEVFKQSNPDFNPNNPQDFKMIQDSFKSALFVGDIPEKLMHPKTQFAAADYNKMYGAIQSAQNSLSTVNRQNAAAQEHGLKYEGYHPNVQRQKEYEMKTHNIDPNKRYTLNGQGVVQGSGYDNINLGPESAMGAKGQTKLDGKKYSWDISGDDQASIMAAIDHTSEMGSKATVGNWSVVRASGQIDQYKAFSDFGKSLDKVKTETIGDKLLSPFAAAYELTNEVGNEIDKQFGTEGTSYDFYVTNNATGETIGINAESGNGALDTVVKNHNPNSRKKYTERYDNYLEQLEAPRVKQMAMTDFGTYNVPTADGGSYKVGTAEYAKSIHNFIQEQPRRLQYYTDDFTDGKKTFEEAVISQVYTEEEIESGDIDMDNLNWGNPGFVVDGTTNGGQGEFLATYTVSRKDGLGNTQVFVPLSDIGGSVPGYAKEAEAWKMSMAYQRAMAAGGDGQLIFEPDTNQPIASVNMDGSVVIPGKGKINTATGKPRELVVPKNQAVGALIAYMQGTL